MDSHRPRRNPSCRRGPRGSLAPQAPSTPGRRRIALVSGAAGASRAGVDGQRAGFGRSRRGHVVGAARAGSPCGRSRAATLESSSSPTAGADSVRCTPAGTRSRRSPAPGTRRPSERSCSVVAGEARVEHAPTRRQSRSSAPVTTSARERVPMPERARTPVAGAFSLILWSSQEEMAMAATALQPVIVTGVPGAMCSASQRIPRLERRTQPCDVAVPSVPPRFSMPCKAI